MLFMQGSMLSCTVENGEPDRWSGMILIKGGTIPCDPPSASGSTTNVVVLLLNYCMEQQAARSLDKHLADVSVSEEQR